MHPEPTPIEPEGFLEGLRWGCIARGALLDFVLSIAVSIPLTLWLAGDAAFSEGAMDDEAVREALRTPGALLLSAVAGLSATTFAAWYGARRAGLLHVRHGGWVAVVSMLLGLPFYGGAFYPLWFEAAWLAAMVPCGMLGGALAGLTRSSCGTPIDH